MDLTNEDVADILALLDSLPYDSLDLQTASFRLTLRRTPDGWTQASEVLSSPAVLEAEGSVAVTVAGAGTGAGAAEAATMSHCGGYNRYNSTSLRSDESAAGAGGADAGGRELVAVRAPLPGTFYRAPRPGADPFVEVGSRVTAETVVCIVETMKLMNSVHAGVGGVVAEICLGNAEFAANGATLMRIEAD